MTFLLSYNPEGSGQVVHSFIDCATLDAGLHGLGHSNYPPAGFPLPKACRWQTFSRHGIQAASVQLAT